MNFGDIIYLDANASAPVLDVAKNALLRVQALSANPSSTHVLGRRARSILDEARVAVANALGGEDKQLFFTSGASEGNRWLVDAVVQYGAALGRLPKVVSTPLEHPSLIKPLENAAQRGLIELKLLPISDSAHLVFDNDTIRNADVIFATAAHNETGRVIDWSALIAWANPAAILIADAAQAMARMPTMPQRVDAIVVSAHKVGAFAGCGAILLRGNAKKLPPPWLGGGQEAGLRPGTEATTLIAAFGAVCQQIDDVRTQHQKLATLRNKLEQELCALFNFARVIALGDDRLPNTSAILFDGVDGEALRIALDAAGVCVGFGSACSALAPEPSRSLIAMGYNTKQTKSVVRFSLPMDISSADVDDAIHRVKITLARVSQATRTSR